jgi:hypothetical protein
VTRENHRPSTTGARAPTPSSSRSGGRARSRPCAPRS